MRGMLAETEHAAGEEKNQTCSRIVVEVGQRFRDAK